MPFAILRFSKQKGGPARAIEAHHERQKESYASNPDIDASKTDLNYHLIQPTASYYREIQARIECVGCKTRKDSVRFVDTILTASPEFFQDRPPEDAHAFFSAALDFMKQEIGEQNIFSAVVHMDERTPHMHLCFVPLTPDNRLSAKELLGNRQKLIQWQDRYHAHMQTYFPELERGHAARETGRKHIPTRLFKQSVHLSHDMNQIRASLVTMRPTNMMEKQHEIMSMLERWYPGVEAFETEIRRLNSEFQALRDDIAQEADPITATDRRNREQNMDLMMLQKEFARYMKLYERIPKEIRDQYAKHRQDKGVSR